MRALAVLAIVVAAAAPARADKAKSEQYFRAGAQAFKQQSFAAAAEQFELAYKEMELPEIAFSAAQAYRRQYFIDQKPEHVKRAVELYRIYLDKVKSGGRVGDAADGLAEMQRELERLTAKGAKLDFVQAQATRLAVSVRIEGEQQEAVSELSALPAGETPVAAEAAATGGPVTRGGAKATLDGKPAELFVPLDVAPGDHEVTVEAPGYFPVTEKRRVVEGATELVEVALKPRPAKLAIHVEAGAQIAIDGRPAGDAPLADQDVAAGKHVVTITARGREPVVRELEVKRGETRTLDLALAHTGKRRAVPWLLGAAGGLALLCGGSTIVAVIADGKMSSLETTRETTGLTESQLSDYHHQVSRRDDFRDAAYVLGGAAIVTAGVAAALYWFDVPRPTEHTTVVPTASPGGAGVAISGHF